MKLQLNLLLTVYAWIIGLAAWLPVGATAQPIRLLQTTPPSQAEQQTVRFGAYEIIMTAQPQQPGQVEVSVKDSQSGQEAFRLSVSDVYSRHYHAAEFHQGHLYIIRRVGDKAAWNDELWRYGTSGPGTKLYSGRGLDFRVAPDESLIAATTDFNLTFIDAEGEAVQEFTVEGLTHRRDEFYAEVDLLSWSDDSAVFWGQLVTVGKPQTIYRIKAGD